MKIFVRLLHPRRVGGGRQRFSARPENDARCPKTKQENVRNEFPKRTNVCVGHDKVKVENLCHELKFTRKVFEKYEWGRKIIFTVKYFNFHIITNGVLNLLRICRSVPLINPTQLKNH